MQTDLSLLLRNLILRQTSYRCPPRQRVAIVEKDKIQRKLKIIIKMPF